MSFAIRNDGLGWRAVTSAEDLLPGESYSENQPVLLFAYSPSEVSRFQALAALLQAGLLDDIEAYMTSADVFTQLAWKEASVFSRSSPLVASIGALAGLTTSQMDDLFRFAATITA